MGGDRRRLGTQVAGAIAGLAALLVSWVTAVLGLRWFRALAQAVRFAIRLVALRAYRRCPDCFRLLRSEASVCRSCGARVRGRPRA